MEIVVAISDLIVPSLQHHEIHDLSCRGNILVFLTHEEEMMGEDGEFIECLGLEQLNDGRFDIIHF